jgi:hypothetical protein
MYSDITPTMHRSLAEYLAEARRAIPVKDHSVPTGTAPTAPITDDLTAYRPLTSEERSFLMWLLEHGVPGATAFLPQLEGMLVKNSCTCGCPSISLHVERDDKLVESPYLMLADQIGTVENQLVGVILRQEGGRLVDLELYDLEGLDRKFGLPDVSTLHLFKPASSGPDET